MKAKIYYDGSCYLCSSEMSHYRKLDRENEFEFIDIASPSFDAVKEGLDPKEAQRSLHVRDEHGSLHVGVDAFIELWRHLPRYRTLGRAAKNPAIRQILKIGYRVFASGVRPYLPKKLKKDCPADHCEF